MKCADRSIQFQLSHKKLSVYAHREILVFSFVYIFERYGSILLRSTVNFIGNVLNFCNTFQFLKYK